MDVRSQVMMLRAALSAAGIVALLFAMTPGPTDIESIFIPSTRPASVEWSQTLHQRFPDCSPRHTAPVPGSVIEVRGGIPMRVGFADAWRRTHDQDLANNGIVIATCTDR